MYNKNQMPPAPEIHNKDNNNSEPPKPFDMNHNNFKQNKKDVPPVYNTDIHGVPQHIYNEPKNNDKQFWIVIIIAGVVVLAFIVALVILFITK